MLKPGDNLPYQYQLVNYTSMSFKNEYEFKNAIGLPDGGPGSPLAKECTKMFNLYKHAIVLGRHFLPYVCVREDKGHKSEKITRRVEAFGFPDDPDILAEMIDDPSSIVTDFFFVWDEHGRQRAVPKLTIPCDVAGMYLLIDLIRLFQNVCPSLGVEHLAWCASLQNLSDDPLDQEPNVIKYQNRDNIILEKTVASFKQKNGT